MPRSLKARKEAFVSNLSGGTVVEINEITLVAATAVFLWSALQSRLGLFRSNTLTSTVADVLLNCGCILAAITVYSDSPLLLNLLIASPAALLVLLASADQTRRGNAPGYHSGQKDGEGHRQMQSSLPPKPFITTYRGAMMVITSIAILAVDFPIFPRRFAKVETWGTSLMDIGVGSFVFSSGLVSARAALKKRLQPTARNVWEDLAQTARHVIPLLALGFIRLLSVKNLDYAEHVSEFGVHWNFFFTLSIILPLVAILHIFFQGARSDAAIAIIVAAVSELALRHTDLKTYILTSPRTDLISKNREGLFSSLGFLSIFLAGHGLGMHALAREPDVSAGKGLRARLSNSGCKQLALWSAFWTLLFQIATGYYGFGLPVSRRLANIPYVLWVAAFNCSQLTLYKLIEEILFGGTRKSSASDADYYKQATSKVLHAFNRNALGMFVLANLLTGLVNLTVPTLEMTALQSMGILVAYTGILSIIAVSLDRCDITIKL